MSAATRTDIIRQALMEKAGHGVSMFTADDILIVAGISEKEIKEFKRQVDDNINRLAAKGGTAAGKE